MEELARIHGFENIPPTLPDLPIRLPERNIERIRKHEARQILSLALGFDEVYNYSFYGDQELEACLLNPTGHMEINNYLSEDQKYMRTTLLPNLLRNVVEDNKYFNEKGTMPSRTTD